MENTNFCKLCTQLKCNVCHNCDLHFQELVLSAIEEYAEKTQDPLAIRVIEENKSKEE